MTQKEIIDKPSSIAYVKRNWAKKGNKEMAAHLGVCVQYVREAAYALGLYRMKLEYWTKQQVTYLEKNYRTIGDKELAILFNKKWPKEKGWSFKHIEKKRMYLKLKRTKEEIDKIRERNIKRGAWDNMSTWETRVADPDGTIKTWNNSYKSLRGTGKFKVIKVAGKFVHYAHWLYIQHFGKFKKDYVVGFKDRNNMNVVPENLEQISRAEHARRNAGNTRIPEDLKALRKTIKELNALINTKKHEREN